MGQQPEKLNPAAEILQLVNDEDKIQSQIWDIQHHAIGYRRETVSWWSSKKSDSWLVLMPRSTYGLDNSLELCLYTLPSLRDYRGRWKMDKYKIRCIRNNQPI